YSTKVSGSVTVSGDIAVSAAIGGVSLLGGSGSYAYAQIGHGGAAAFDGVTPPGGTTVSGDISVAAGGNARLAGGSGLDTDALIGHGDLSNNSTPFTI